MHKCMNCIYLKCRVDRYMGSLFLTLPYHPILFGSPMVCVYLNGKCTVYTCMTEYKCVQKRRKVLLTMAYRHLQFHNGRRRQIAIHIILKLITFRSICVP